jgi:hypothetical protein
MKIVVWKDGTWIATSKPTWEYENDPNWLMTIEVPAGETEGIKL